ncbi:MAG TPA: hypothetical protein DDW27_11650 [Bacteroidales bacterium]|nr:hypothetical protein [Bacteroidales bacterium]
MVFSFENPEEAKSEFLKELFKSSQSDKRISVLHGDKFGDFEFITKYLMPYSDDKDPKETFYKTFLELQKLTVK